MTTWKECFLRKFKAEWISEELKSFIMPDPSWVKLNLNLNLLDKLGTLQCNRDVTAYRFLHPARFPALYLLLDLWGQWTAHPQVWTNFNISLQFWGSITPRTDFEFIQLPLPLVSSFTLMIANDEMIMMMVMTTVKCLLLLTSFFFLASFYK